jgi:hypothetical protein
MDSVEEDEGSWEGSALGGAAFGGRGSGYACFAVCFALDVDGLSQEGRGLSLSSAILYLSGFRNGNINGTTRTIMLTGPVRHCPCPGLTSTTRVALCPGVTVYSDYKPCEDYNLLLILPNCHSGQKAESSDRKYAG